MTAFLIVAAIGIIAAVVLLLVFALAVMAREMPEDES